MLSKRLLLKQYYSRQWQSLSYKIPPFNENKDYFNSSRKWVFGLIAASALIAGCKS
jgi:hypothetical protein